MSRSRAASLIAGGVVVVATIAVGTGPRPAAANQATQPVQAICLADWYCSVNYEHKDTTSVNSSNNVDWATDQIYWNNADTSLVRSKLEAIGYGNLGSTKYMGQFNGQPWQLYWAVDNGGRKNDAPATCVNEHAYSFAPNGFTMSFVPNGWGYVVFGSTHQDINEGNWRGWCDSERFGWSETAEQLTGQRIAASGWQVNYDYLGMSNYQYGWDSIEPLHYWENNGYATALRVP